MLADIANLAYNDARLPDGVRALQGAGERVLLVVLLREHRGRAASMMRFRRSRGERTALLGARRLEAAVVADRLTADDLARIYAIDADALTLRFEALTGDPAGALAALYSQCGIEMGDGAPVARAVNESERARFVPLAALGKAAALTLRRLGCRRLLQRVKDSAGVRRAFFVAGASDARLSAEAEATLAAAYAECEAAVEAGGERVCEGVYLRRAKAGADERAVA